MEILKKDIIHFRITYSLLTLAILSLPFTSFLLLPIEILILLNWIIQWDWKRKLSNLRNNHLCKSLIIALLFPALTILCFSYSRNLPYALADFDCKSWLILAPLVIFTINKKLFTQDKIRLLLFIFILSTVLMILSNFTISYYQSICSTDKNINYFSYINLSHNMHPSYNSMYVCLSFILSFYRLLIYKINVSRYKRLNFAVLLSCLIISPIYIFALQSKAGIIVFILCFIYLFIYYTLKNRARVYKIIIVLLLFGGIYFIYNSLSVGYASRFKSVVSDFQKIKLTEDTKFEEIGSTGQRIKIWRITSEAIRDNLPFGVGTGDVQDCLNSYYKKNNFSESVIEKNLNTHNQYLQTSLALGIPGLISLILLFCYPLYFAIKTKDHIYILFLIIVTTNLLVENMLNIRAGVNFIAIFNSIFWFNLFSCLSPKNSKQLDTKEQDLTHL